MGIRREEWYSREVLTEVDVMAGVGGAAAVMMGLGAEVERDVDGRAALKPWEAEKRERDLREQREGRGRVRESVAGPAAVRQTIGGTSWSEIGKNGVRVYVREHEPTALASSSGNKGKRKGGTCGGGGSHGGSGKDGKVKSTGGGRWHRKREQGNEEDEPTELRDATGVSMWLRSYRRQEEERANRGRRRQRHRESYDDQRHGEARGNGQRGSDRRRRWFGRGGRERGDRGRAEQQRLELQESKREATTTIVSGAGAGAGGGASTASIPRGEAAEMAKVMWRPGRSESESQPNSAGTESSGARSVQRLFDALVAIENDAT